MIWPPLTAKTEPPRFQRYNGLLATNAPSRVRVHINVFQNTYNTSQKMPLFHALHISTNCTSAITKLYVRSTRFCSTSPPPTPRFSLPIRAYSQVRLKRHDFPLRISKPILCYSTSRSSMKRRLMYNRSIEGVPRSSVSVDEGTLYKIKLV